MKFFVGQIVVDTSDDTYKYGDKKGKTKVQEIAKIVKGKGAILKYQPKRIVPFKYLATLIKTFPLNK